MTDRTALMCLPYAGGLASGFRRWQRLLGDAVEVHPRDYPGRATRRREPLIVDARRLAEDAAQHVRELGAERTVLFGHSMGAWTAYEATLLLERSGDRPAGLIVSGAPAPRFVAAREPNGKLDDEQLRAKCLEWGGTPVELLDHPTFREQMFPHLRADLQTIDGYRPSVDGTVEAPMTTLAGREDTTAPSREVAEWAAHSQNWHGDHIVIGGHFFTTTAEALVVRLVGQHCRTARSPIADRPGGGPVKGLPWHR